MAAFLCTLVFGVAVDQATKALALKYLTAQSNVPLVGNWIRLTLLHNSGATMSFASSNTMYLSIFAIIAVVALAWIGLRTKSLWWSLTLGLTASGALGNVIDRVLYQRTFLDGAVVDFINYGPFVGNVADIILGIAAALIIIGILRSEKFGLPRLDAFIYPAENIDSKPQHDTKGQDA